MEPLETCDILPVLRLQPQLSGVCRESLQSSLSLNISHSPTPIFSNATIEISQLTTLLVTTAA